jgi:hypothetical protein
LCINNFALWSLPFIACPSFALSASFANVNKALFK